MVYDNNVNSDAFYAGGSVRQKVRLTIAGNEYIVNTDEEERYIKDLAAEVDRRLTTLMNENPHLSTTMAAVYCALDLCDERSRRDAEIEALRERVRRAENDSASATVEANEAVREIRRLTDEVLRLRQDKA